MFDDSRSFISRSYLQSVYDADFAAYVADGKDQILLERLTNWAARKKQTETQDETAFISTFFEEIWGYSATGRSGDSHYSYIPKFAVPSAGAKGGSGEADLVLGRFQGVIDAVPQVLCEFKDIRSALDAKQNRKGSNLTPVEQCLNYVRNARRSQYGNEPVQPWWGLVKDMNEFRLYWWDRAPREYVKFTIKLQRDTTQAELFEQRDLLTEHPESQFDRFLFTKLFHRDMLIAQSGKPALWRKVEHQWNTESKIEKEFYGHYKGLRERLFNVLKTSNPDFSGTPTDLLRVSQKLLDRFIFAFYCEDMGERMLFEPQFIRDYLMVRSKERTYKTNGTDIWEFFKEVFSCMNSGDTLGQMPFPMINGGLFKDDPLINSLRIPNDIFAAPGQGDGNEASLAKDKQTFLYLSGNYNYAAKGDAKESLSLYTLGRIFEQSITELEYRVGELEGRETAAKLSKRKRDGVYYTPERVVNYMVEETLGPWFADAKLACGYGDEADLDVNLAASKAYLERLRTIRIIDPACGSGAFLISAFRRLLDERKAVARQIGGPNLAIDETPLIAEILTHNVFGVDINPSSVEIAKLALWLHSARAKAPLSALDHTIRCGNSLVAPDCWQIIEKTEENETRINPFDWGDERYDIVLGNPPYVKLQNLMKLDADVVAYLQAQRPIGTYATGTYESAQTGNFDLYLPFIELGLRLLSEHGRMAYIAPALWAVNDYGQGLRRHIHRTRQLERWIDFKSYQVFEEAITYTALQFFTAGHNETVKVVISPDGETGDIDWNDKALAVPSADLRDDREWLMATGEDRNLIERLAKDCVRLDDKSVTSGITVGIQTSADWIYHLRKLGNNSYECSPPKQASYVVEIEDPIMKPLISGPEAQRYEVSKTETFLLFPYHRNAQGNMVLFEPADFRVQFPQAWRYLCSHESELRSREKSSFDDAKWFRFG